MRHNPKATNAMVTAIAVINLDFWDTRPIAAGYAIASTVRAYMT